jgi:hypothetical protein
MKNIKTFLKEHGVVLSIMLVFLVAKIVLSIVFGSVFFDEYDYVGMAKFFYSFGDSGFFSDTRPFVIPLIIGLGWKLGFDVVIFGKIIAVLFSLATLWMTYLISRRLFGKNVANISVFFLAFFPLFFSFAHRILTEIPGMFFVLLSFYLFINKRYGWCGFFASLAFMTKYPYGIVLVPFLLFLVFKIKKFKETAIFCFAYSVPFVSFSLFNIFFYRKVTANFFDSIIRPFVIANVTVMVDNVKYYKQPFFYYFVQMFFDNFLVVLAILFFVFYFTARLYRKSDINLFLACGFLLSFYFSWLLQKDYRYALDFLPFIIVLVAFCVDRILFFFSQVHKFAFYLSLAILIIFVAFNSFYKIPVSLGYLDTADKDICNFFKDYEGNYSVFSTTPVIVPCLENRFYGRYIDLPKHVDLFFNTSDYDVFVFSNSTFLCIDDVCEKEKVDSLNKLKSDADLVFETSSKFEYFAVFKKK